MIAAITIPEMIGSTTKAGTTTLVAQQQGTTQIAASVGNNNEGRPDYDITESRNKHW